MSLIYNGTTITSVVYNGTTLTSLVYNGTTVFVSSFGMFFGGYTGAESNLCTRIDSLGVSISETAVASSTARFYLAGATVGGKGMFFGGYTTGAASKLCTRIDSLGALVSAETSVGTARYGLAGATVGGNGLFYGGFTN